MQNYPYGSEEQIGAAIAAYSACVGIFFLLLIALQIWLFWRILTRAGMNGWLSLLSLLGGIGTIILLFILALGDWPALRGTGGTGYAPPPGGSGYTPSAPTYTPPPPTQAPTYAPPAPPAEPTGEEPPPGPMPQPPA